MKCLVDPLQSPARAACLSLQGRLLAAFALRTHAAHDDTWACVSEEGAAQWLQVIGPSASLV